MQQVSPVFDYNGSLYIQRRQRRTMVNILRLPEAFQNATINRTTREAVPQIGTDRSSQTLQNPQVDRYRSEFGQPRSGGSGCWMCVAPNQSIIAVRTRTAGRSAGPVANTSRVGFMDHRWSPTPQDRGIRMGYKNPFIPPKVTATCNILNHTPICFISYLVSMVVYHHFDSQNMSMNRSPLKTVNMAAPGGLFDTQECCVGNAESSENSSQSTTGKHSWCGNQTNQYHAPYGYGCPPSQPPFPGTAQFYQQSPFNKTHSLQPMTSAREVFLRYKQLWQRYDRHGGG